jgi:hypothetical protein
MTSTLTESSTPGCVTDESYASPNPTAREWEPDLQEGNPTDPTTRPWEATTTPSKGESVATGLTTPEAPQHTWAADPSDAAASTPAPITPETLQQRRKSSAPGSASSTQSALSRHSQSSACDSAAGGPGESSPQATRASPSAGAIPLAGNNAVAPDMVRPASPDDGPRVSPSFFGLRPLSCVTCLAGPQHSAPQPLAEAVRNPARNCAGSFPGQNSLILDRNLSTGSGWSALIPRTPTTSGSMHGSPLSPLPTRMGPVAIGGSPLAPSVAADGGAAASPAAMTPGRWARSFTAPSTPSSYSSQGESAGDDSPGGLSECERAEEDNGTQTAAGGDWVTHSFQAAIYNAVRNQLEVESEKEMLRKLAASTGAAAPAGGGGMPQEADWARGAGRPMEASTRKLAACFERAIHDAMEARPPSAEGRTTRPTATASAGAPDPAGNDAVRRSSFLRSSVLRFPMDDSCIV